MNDDVKPFYVGGFNLSDDVRGLELPPAFDSGGRVLAASDLATDDRFQNNHQRVRHLTEMNREIEAVFTALPFKVRPATEEKPLPKLIDDPPV